MNRLLKLPKRPFHAVLVLLVAATLALSLGINKPTGLTGKDEYLLGLRVPLEMMQRNVWWVPYIDGQPRLKKPPLMYWLGRASFERFGPSLPAGRGITVAFALLLLGCTVWLGKRLGGGIQSGLLAGAILLGCGGLASESRRLMLDVPVAALSTAAFCFYLRWVGAVAMPRPSGASLNLLASAMLLSAALMTKGPIAVVVFGAGIGALLINKPELRQLILGRVMAQIVFVALSIALPLIWLRYVQHHFAAELASAAHDELEARQAAGISLDALIGLATIALPWSVMAAHALWTRRREPETRFLGLWLILTLLPFLFIRSFERYLIGSLAPLALVTAMAVQNGTTPNWTRRLGSLVPAGLALALCLLLWRFGHGGWGWLGIALTYFVWAWWWPTMSINHLVVSAIVLWATGWGVAFPKLEVNAIPSQVVELAAGRDVVLFAGPQPALLPILTGKPLRQTSQLTAADLHPASLIMVRAEDRTKMQQQIDALHMHLRFVNEYAALTSSGSGIRFAKEGATRDDWKRAWASRSPDPLVSNVLIFVVTP
jgi:4-amino-4-deoxy-L-arabinose transferase-like glycosyltransferase